MREVKSEKSKPEIEKQAIPKWKSVKLSKTQMRKQKKINTQTGESN